MIHREAADLTGDGSRPSSFSVPTRRHVDPSPQRLGQGRQIRHDRIEDDGIVHGVVAVDEPIAQADGERQVGDRSTQFGRLVERTAGGLTQDRELSLDRRPQQTVAVVLVESDAAQEALDRIRRVERVTQMSLRCLRRRSPIQQPPRAVPRAAQIRIGDRLVAHQIDRPPEHALQRLGQTHETATERALVRGRVARQAHDEVEIAALGIEAPVGRRPEDLQTLDAVFATQGLDGLAVFDQWSGERRGVHAADHPPRCGAPARSRFSASSRRSTSSSGSAGVQSAQP